MTSGKHGSSGATTPADELLTWQVVRAMLGETLRFTSTGMKTGVSRVYPVEVELTNRPMKLARKTTLITAITPGTLSVCS